MSYLANFQAFDGSQLDAGEYLSDVFTLGIEAQTLGFIYDMAPLAGIDGTIGYMELLHSEDGGETWVTLGGVTFDATPPRDKATGDALPQNWYTHTWINPQDGSAASFEPSTLLRLRFVPVQSVPMNAQVVAFR